MTELRAKKGQAATNEKYGEEQAGGTFPSAHRGRGFSPRCVGLIVFWQIVRENIVPDVLGWGRGGHMTQHRLFISWPPGRKERKMERAQSHNPLPRYPFPQ